MSQKVVIIGAGAAGVLDALPAAFSLARGHTGNFKNASYESHLSSCFARRCQSVV